MESAETSRIDQIMKVDVTSLLRTIKGIEDQITSYAKLERQPQWATEIISRLDRLSSTSSSQSREDLMSIPKDDNILIKMNNEIDSRLSAVKFSIESKLSTHGLEFDRLHRLLDIRPTTSELQSLVLKMNEMENRTKSYADDFSQSAKPIVQAVVTEQMDSIMAKLRSNDELHEKGLGIVFKKIDMYSRDIADMKSSIAAFMKSAEDSVAISKQSNSTFLESVNSFSSKFDNDLGQLQQSVAEMQVSNKLMSDSFELSLDKMKDQIEDMAKDAQILKNDTADNYHRMHEKIDEVFDYSKELKNAHESLVAAYESTKDNLSDKVENSISTIVGVQERVQEVDNYLEFVKSLDLSNKLLNFETQIESIDGKLASQDLFNANVSACDSIRDSQISELSLKVSEIFESIDTQKVSNESFLAKHASADVSIEKLQQFTGKLNEDLGKLFVICEEIALLRDVQVGFEQRLKAQQSIITGLMSTTEDHEQRIEQIIDIMDKSDESLARKMDEMRGSIMDILMEKQAAMDGAIQNMRDNLDIISTAGDGTTNKNKNNRSYGSKGTNHSSGPSGIDGLGASADEQRALSLSQAQFIADLCINFEDIAVRKTFVPEIPPAMCEHVTTTCQSLTSFIATCTDSEIVQRVLSDPSYSELDNPDVAISDLRQRKIEEFIFEVKAVVDANHPQPGMIRQDARDKFLKQLYKGLQIFISKYDQVLIVGNSRLGRLKIPTCIACDRPLVEKARQDVIIRHDISGRPENMARFDDPASFSSSDSLLESSIITKANLSWDSKNQVPLKLPSGSLKSGSSSSLKGSASQDPQNSYILRGGFKMPRISNYSDGSSQQSLVSASLPDLKPEKRSNN